MKLIKISDIQITSDRQRQLFNENELDTLRNSISRLGLLHPIVLENDERTLRAGERRVKAAAEIKTAYFHDGQTVPPGFIPFTTLGELTEVELFEIELEENIQRSNITWQERAAAYARLFELQQKIAGTTPLTVADFGRALHPEAARSTAVIVGNHLKLAPHLADPEVATAKTMKEAENIIRRKNESILRTELLSRVGEVKSPHQLFNASAFDQLPLMSPNSVDIILTDPPYGINMDKMNTQSGSNSGYTHTYQDDETYAAQCVSLIANEGMRVTKASAICYMFCDIRLWEKWSELFEKAGWYIWPFPVIWNKTPTGSLLGRANGPRHVYEAILIAIKEGRQVNFVGEDVISIPGPQVDKLHPAEKPVALYERLLSWSAAPGDVVLDPFAGCGPIFPACESHGCFAIACEKDSEHFAKAELRRQNLGKELL